MAGKKTGNLNQTTIAEAANDKAAVYKLKNAKGDNVFTGAAAKGKVRLQLTEHLKGGEQAIPGAKSFQLTQKETVGEARKSAERIIKRDAPRHNK